jgi:hypothetical protein
MPARVRPGSERGNTLPVAVRSPTTRRMADSTRRMRKCPDLGACRRTCLELRSVCETSLSATSPVLGLSRGGRRYHRVRAPRNRAGSCPDPVSRVARVFLARSTGLVRCPDTRRRTLPAELTRIAARLLLPPAQVAAAQGNLHPGRREGRRCDIEVRKRRPGLHRRCRGRGSGCRSRDGTAPPIGGGYGPADEQRTQPPARPGSQQNKQQVPAATTSGRPVQRDEPTQPERANGLVRVVLAASVWCWMAGRAVPGGFAGWLGCLRLRWRGMRS